MSGFVIGFGTGVSSGGRGAPPAVCIDVDKMAFCNSGVGTGDSVAGFSGGMVEVLSC